MGSGQMCWGVYPASPSPPCRQAAQSVNIMGLVDDPGTLLSLWRKVGKWARRGGWGPRV